MTRRSYEVSSPHVGVIPSKTPDSSFKSCLCTMLVVLVICSLLVLLAFSYRTFGSQDKTQADQDMVNSNHLHGRRAYKSTPSSKQLPSSTQTPENEEIKSNTSMYTINDSITFRDSYSEDNETTKQLQGITPTAAVSSTERKGEKVNISSDSKFNNETATENSQTSIPNEHEGSSTTEIILGDEETSTHIGIHTEFTKTSQRSNKTDQNDGSTTEMIIAMTSEPDEKKNINQNATEEIVTGKVETQSSTENSTTTTNSDTSHTTMHDDTSITEGSTESQEIITSSGIHTKFNNFTEIRKLQQNNTTRQDYSSTTQIIDEKDTKSDIEKYIHRNEETQFEPGEFDPWSSSETSTLIPNLQDFTKITCNSTICSSIAHRMIGSMDVVNAPCENFYEFACGRASGFEENNEEIFTELVLKKKDRPNFVNTFDIFYKSCLSYEDRFHYGERIDEAKGLLHTIGSFEFEGQPDENNNLTDYISNLILLKVMPFFDVDVDIDHKNSTYILKLLKPDQTSLNLDHWSSFTDDKRKCIRIIEEAEVALPKNISTIHETFIKCQLNYSDYFDSIETSMKELGLTERQTNSYILDVRYFIEENILNIIYKIMNSLPVLQEEMATRKYDKLTLVQLEKRIPSIKWMRLFQLITNIDMNDETEILIHDINYFTEMFKIFDNGNEREWKNAFLAILAKSLYHSAVQRTDGYSRKKYCREISRELMPDISNYIVEEKMSVGEIPKSHNHVKELYTPLREYFKESLEDFGWLDDQSKISMKKKLDSIQLVLLDTIDVSNEEQILEKHYAHLNFTHGNYQRNLFNLMKHSKKRLLSLHGQSVTPANMYRNFVDVTKKEPIFFYTSNIVCIPHGMTKQETRELPNYINLAQFGFSFAKIIGYTFDPIGMQYGVELQEPAQQIYDIFVNNTRDTIAFSDPIFFRDQQYRFTLTNSLSLSERIAENTALKLLEDFFKTMNKQHVLPLISQSYTPEKTFLLAVTQEFCRKMSLMQFTIQAIESPILPPQFRVENLMSNSKQFSEEFSCNPGSGMTRMNSGSRFPDLPNDQNLDYI